MSNDNLQFKEFYKLMPGFFMGISRAIISHPFEILKLKSQMNIKNNFYNNLFNGIHLSIITNSTERAIQFYFFEKLKNKYNNNIISSFYSSLISTSITLPYNIIMLKNIILNTNYNINTNILFKSSILEYTRNLSGSTIFLYTYDKFRSNNYPIYMSGSISSISVWCIIYPIDNIKNQIIASNKIHYDIKFLYKGIKYPIIRSIPSSIIGFYIYEYFNNYIKKIENLP